MAAPREMLEVGVAVTTMTTGVCVDSETAARVSVGVPGGVAPAPPFWRHRRPQG